MNTKDFYFDLPKELIAQEPLLNRSASRMLCLNRATGEVAHNHFEDIVDLIQPQDCLVINNTKVMPARLYGNGKDGKDIEILLLNRVPNNDNIALWEVLVKPGKWAKVGSSFDFGGLMSANIAGVKENGNRIIEFKYDGIFEEILDELGEMPLPPYITKRLEDKGRYQTVYAKEVGSAAAPTAGLHFTNEILDKIRAKGAAVVHITLHVGLGTFRPVKSEKIQDHEMHEEYYNVDNDAARIINERRRGGGRVIAVGTTSMRTLESVADLAGIVHANSGYTGIFIYPGHVFKGVDCLLTNFHLPESTLIMLVSAFSSREYILNAYNEAIAKEYRFFSFGDAMFLYK